MPDLYEMSESDLLRHMGLDAQKWAEAFCEIKQRQGWSADDIDFHLMTTWFANAIEAGRAECRKDHTSSKGADDVISAHTRMCF